MNMKIGFSYPDITAKAVKFCFKVYPSFLARNSQRRN